MKRNIVVCLVSRCQFDLCQSVENCIELYKENYFLYNVSYIYSDGDGSSGTFSALLIFFLHVDRLIENKESEKNE